jgi:hypothetical protein
LLPANEVVAALATPQSPSRRPSLTVTQPAPGGVRISRYDYFLGGKDNFAADRELAERLIATWPGIIVLATQNKAFTDRAVTWVAGQGISPVRCRMPFTSMVADG